MKLKPYFYEAFDGVHYPDTVRGSKYVYGMDLNSFLDANGGTLVSVVWDLEEGLLGTDEFMHPNDVNIACINIETPYVGSFWVSLFATYTAAGVEQQMHVPLIIKVY